VLRSNHENLHHVVGDMLNFWKGYESEKIIPIPSEFVAQWINEIRRVFQNEEVEEEPKDV